MIENFYITQLPVYRETEITGSYGQPFITSSLLTTMVGHLESLSGNENYINDKKDLTANYLYYTAVTDITEKDYIIYSGETYDISFVNPTFKNHHLEILLLKRK